jgi:hypothetical protein
VSLSRLCAAALHLGRAQLITAMLTPDATLNMALNGNRPAHDSTYDDADREVLKAARIPIPAFDEASRAGEIFKEAAEAAVLGMKTLEAAMAAVVHRVTPLLSRWVERRGGTEPPRPEWRIRRRVVRGTPS